MAIANPIRSLRTALAGGWSPLGAAMAAAIGVAYLLGLAWLVLWLSPHPPVGLRPGVATVAVTIGGSKFKLEGIAARPESAAELSAMLKRPESALNWRLGGGTPFAVPPVYLAKLPDGLEDLPSVRERKRLFVVVVLPLLLAVNEKLRAMRARVVGLRDRLARGLALSSEDADWLARTADSYDADPNDFETLLRRLDIVPVPLALAQAAIESAWGTSRFSREGNALFGQWTWSDDRGLVPAARAESANHSVRRFARLVDSVASYVHNLNTHAAYAEFRKRRAALRAAGKPILAVKLAATLTSYSERRADYVNEILRVIRHNRFDRLRDARLDEHALD